MSDIFQEVQEEYRREQMAKLWAKYRVPIIAGVSALVLGVAGYQGGSYWHTSRTEAASREFEKVAELLATAGENKETAKQAAEGFAKLAADAPHAYAIAARFQEAGLRTELNEIAAAVKIYDEISASTSDPVFRDYAQLRAAILLLEPDKYENTKKRLEPITRTSSPWRVMALEMLAYATWRAGKKDEALKMYAEVAAAPNAPNGNVRRAKEMTTLINAGMKLTDLVAKPGVSTPGAGTGSMLLQPSAPGPSQPLLPDPTVPDPGLLGPAAPATPDQPQPPTP